jgi:hypothetical protein
MLYQVQQVIQPSLFSVYDSILSASDVNGLHMWLNSNKILSLLEAEIIYLHTTLPRYSIRILQT